MPKATMQIFVLVLKEGWCVIGGVKIIYLETETISNIILWM